MLATKIKFCGLVRDIDVELAVQLRVDAIGFVFYPPSPRYLDVAHAARLRSLIPEDIKVVGLFVNSVRAEVESLVSELSLDIIQFHGHETPEDLSGWSVPVWKAVHMRSGQDLVLARAQFATANALLMDTPSEAFGGSGQTFDWSMIPQVCASSTVSPTQQLIVSGGLNASNVAQAIALLRPDMVDVSSGIQGKNPREKDHQRMGDFVAATRLG